MLSMPITLRVPSVLLVLGPLRIPWSRVRSGIDEPAWALPEVVDPVVLDLPRARVSIFSNFGWTLHRRRSRIDSPFLFCPPLYRPILQKVMKVATKSALIDCIDLV